MSLRTISHSFLTLLGLLALSCSQAGIPELRPSSESLSYDPARKSGSKNLCVFMDGTANDHDSQSNLRHLYELVSHKNNRKTLCYYDTGVGAEKHKVFGATAGQGFTKNIRQAFAFLASAYEPGDKIYLFGYSRGARQAQVLADLVARCGIPNLDYPATEKQRESNMDAVSPIVETYKKSWKTANQEANRDPITANETTLKFENHFPAEIEFVGLWDVVESLADNLNSQNLLYLGTKQNVRYQPHSVYPYKIHPKIKKSYHAMALDEVRGLYEVIPWIVPKNHPGIVERVWFPGSHGDIGGSYNSSERLGAVSLNWMMSKLDHTGLLPRPGYRIDKNPLGLAVDSRKFKVAGKFLGKVRKDRIRRETFWDSFWDPDKKQPGSMRKIPTQIHQSIISRLKAKKVILQHGSNSVSYENLIPYRPLVFQKRKADEVFQHCFPSIPDDASAVEIVRWLKNQGVEIVN